MLMAVVCDGAPKLERSIVQPLAASRSDHTASVCGVGGWTEAAAAARDNDGGTTTGAFGITAKGTIFTQR